ncbi:MAG: R2-like ligand-binding oxidase [Anaerolineae bacterium]|nr:MAG: R2-like ligand-binding oxidase [Anaerolineae bacterium]
MRLNQDLLPLKDYHKAKKLMWDPMDIDLTQDKADWQALTGREKDLVIHALGLFLGGEAFVTHDLAPLLVALRHNGGSIEEEMFITTQLFEESKHVEFFDRVLNEVLQLEPDLEQLAGANYRRLFETELSTALGRLLTDHSKEAQVEAVCTYHMIIEGVLAETGYYGIFTALKKRNLMPGLIRGLELVQRDEARHVAFGIHLLSRLVKENPAFWGVMEARINTLLILAQGVFIELLESFLPDIPFDLKIEDFVEYAGKQYMARMSVLERAKSG